MLNYLDKLSTREKLVFGVSAAIIVVLLLHALIIEPYQIKQSSLTQELEQAIDDLRWMESEVHRLPSNAIAGQNRQFNGSLAKLIDKGVREQKLGSHLAQMTPVGDDQIRVRFTSIAFDRLLRFIASTNSQGLSVKDLRVNASDKQAEVNASLVLEKNG